MILDKRLAVIMRAYNAEMTLRDTYQDLPHEYVDDVMLVDDVSKDFTLRIAQALGIKTIIHAENLGYVRTRKPAIA